MEEVCVGREHEHFLATSKTRRGRRRRRVPAEQRAAERACAESASRPRPACGLPRDRGGQAARERGIAAEASPSTTREPVRVPAASAPPRGNVQSPVAGAIGNAPPTTTPARPVVSSKPLPPTAASPFPTPSRPPTAVIEPTGGSLDLAIALALEGNATADKPAPPPPPAGEHLPSSESDEAALRETFEDARRSRTCAESAASMMEVRWGEAQTSWLELGASGAASRCAGWRRQVGHAALVAALDGFDAALQRCWRRASRPTLAGPSRDALLAAYAPLAQLPAARVRARGRARSPRAAHRARAARAGAGPRAADDRQDDGGRARHAVARSTPRAPTRSPRSPAIPDAVAAAIAARIQAFRRATPAALATVDPARDGARARRGCSSSCAAEHARVRGAPRAAGRRPIARRRSSSARRAAGVASCRSRSSWCAWARSTSPCASTKLPFAREDRRARAARQPAGLRQSRPRRSSGAARDERPQSPPRRPDPIRGGNDGHG